MWVIWAFALLLLLFFFWIVYFDNYWATGEKKKNLWSRGLCFPAIFAHFGSKTLLIWSRLWFRKVCIVLVDYRWGAIWMFWDTHNQRGLLQSQSCQLSDEIALSRRTFLCLLKPLLQNYRPEDFIWSVDHPCEFLDSILTLRTWFFVAAFWWMGIETSCMGRGVAKE